MGFLQVGLSRVSSLVLDQARIGDRCSIPGSADASGAACGFGEDSGSASGAGFAAVAVLVVVGRPEMM